MITVEELKECEHASDELVSIVKNSIENIWKGYCEKNLLKKVSVEM